MAKNKKNKVKVIKKSEADAQIETELVEVLSSKKFRKLLKKLLSGLKDNDLSELSSNTHIKDRYTKALNKVINLAYTISDETGLAKDDED